MRQRAVLLVEDEPMTREGMRKALEVWSAGRYPIYVADNARDALQMMEELELELVVTDIRMPEMNGLEFVQAMADKLQAYMPPVILISGYAEFAYAQQAIRLGVVRYLLKPVSNDKLIEAVEHALSIQAQRSRVGVMERLLDPVLHEAHAQQGRISDSVAEALRYIDQHLNQAFGLKEVATHVHLNPSYFSVLFKEEMQLTFSDYVTRRRLQRAKELLVQTKLPIVEIAERVGYKTAKYFNKLFKEYEKQSPGQYRKRMSDRSD
ncbi:response regulator [Xylanibacillus composti]|uniref:DNA-binding response regulator n=1 Tax=Xylanibacillus composti TaxID=1572762 RepID=A0A8J4M0D6_9BACL|nr:response regulator [Xylanibacillus composti]MDT9723882.1 response regulator [Xylanibacillus composti]GIQ67339.1 DNA-binding response regulator [Xylanibacillus composti]